MSETLTLSPQQESVLECFRKNPRVTGNIDIESVAGSGKTFILLRGLLELVGGDTAFMAFAKDISVEIEEKVEAIARQLRTQVQVGTVHRFGRQIIARTMPGRRMTIMKKTEKADKLMDEVRDPKTGMRGVPIVLRAFVRKAYILSRQWGIGINPEFPFGSREMWYKLVDHFDLEETLISDEDNIPVDLDEMVRQACNWTVHVLKLGIEWSKRGDIDFEDMIWIPLVRNMNVIHTKQFDTILVDERQDLNWTRTALVRKLLRPGGRAVFVGDTHQAIFGFTGADAKATENIQRGFNTNNLKLSVSFRCAKSVVRFVQQWVSHIEAHPDAPEGISPLDPGGTIDAAELFSQNLSTEKGQDAILCRNNAPLVELFFQLLKRGIPAHIEGREIGDELIRVLNKFPKVKAWDTLKRRLEAYKEKEVQRLTAKGHEEKADRIADIVDAILAVMDGMPPTSKVSDIRTKITSMFQDDNGEKTPTLTLTTSHKAKGREWYRVFWYGRNRWNPSPYARQDWQMEQEINLMYVAGTRAKHTLIDVIVPAPMLKRR